MVYFIIFKKKDKDKFLSKLFLRELKNKRENKNIVENLSY